MFEVESVSKDTQDGVRYMSRNIENEAVAFGFRVARYNVSNHDRADMFSSQLLIKDPPYSSIFDMKHDGSGYIIRSPKFSSDIRVECHFQQQSGSTWAKLPFFMLNAQECLPETEIIFVLDGDEMPAGAVKWMKESARKTHNKSIRVMSLAEYLDWFRVSCRSKKHVAAEPMLDGFTSAISLRR